MFYSAMNTTVAINMRQIKFLVMLIKDQPNTRLIVYGMLHINKDALLKTKKNC